MSRRVCSSGSSYRAFLGSRKAKTEGCCTDEGETYRVARSKFLLGADDSSTTLSLVDCPFSSDNGFALRRASARLASDLSYGVPIV